MKEEIKILIVEDEALIAMYLKAKFTRLGYSLCETAADEKTALHIFDTEKPDIILSDIMLANGDNGIDVMMKIRETTPILPIVFLTGYEEDSIKQRALPLKPLGFFIKPIDVDEVSRVIETFFNL